MSNKIKICATMKEIIPASRLEQIGTNEAFPAWYVVRNIINQIKNIEVRIEY
jgi:hypothetical protein